MKAYKLVAYGLNDLKNILDSLVFLGYTNTVSGTPFSSNLVYVNANTDKSITIYCNEYGYKTSKNIGITKKQLHDKVVLASNRRSDATHTGLWGKLYYLSNDETLYEFGFEEWNKLYDYSHALYRRFLKELKPINTKLSSRPKTIYIKEGSYTKNDLLLLSEKIND